MLDSNFLGLDFNDLLIPETLLNQDVLLKGTANGSSSLTNKMIAVSTPNSRYISDFSGLESRLLEANTFFKTNWHCKESVAKAFAAGVMLHSLEYPLEASMDFFKGYAMFGLTEKPKLTLLAEAIGFSKPTPLIVSHGANITL